jgi:hypothetical protein
MQKVALNVSPAIRDFTFEGMKMKKFGRLLIAAILLTFAMSTASFADGSFPPPTCTPGHCPGQ